MPHPRRLERAAIVAATIDVLDERGLDGLSLHAIAAHLGVRQPALYHHFPSKGALLDAAAAEVLDRHHTARLPEPDEPWREFLARNARSLRRALLAVRDGARLIAATGPRAPEPAAALARIESMERQGFTAAGAVLASIALSRYVIGCVLEEQSAPSPAVVSGSEAVREGEVPPAFARLASAAAEVAALGADGEFDAGLQALIRGLEPA
ncbi:TetR/AcrR family transcriptional regulator C-terminal domain-containing protein [Glycomyces scopariae]